jgi:putative chitinase
LNLTNSDLARILHCPEANVEKYWPLISGCLDSLHIGSDNSKIAALATIAVETANRFEPLHEYGSAALHEKEYAGRLGNVNPGDGAKFAGRGFIQLTGEVNYLQYGKELGIDLLKNPEEACAENAASAIFAAFWHDKKCDVYADAERWIDVRHRVNGGENGLAPFLRYVNDLKAAITEKAEAAHG